MERSEILTAMGELKLYGMKAAFDEIIATAVKRQHEPQRIVGDLLTAEISEKQARSIKYQIAIARLPMAKEIDEFVFDATPINETLVRDIHQAVVAMQFQDTVSQRLAHVTEALDEMNEALDPHVGSGAKTRTTFAWLEELKRSYTMRAEREAMVGNVEDSTAAQLNAEVHSDNNVELF